MVSVPVPLLPVPLPRVADVLVTLPPFTASVPTPLWPMIKRPFVAHVPLDTVTVPSLPTSEPRKLSLLVTLPPFTFKRPGPL